MLGTHYGVWLKGAYKCYQCYHTLHFCPELLKFLDIQARHHESVTHSVQSPPNVTQRIAYVAGPAITCTCVACKKGNHPLHRCRKFQGMTRDERGAFVKKNSCCINCLKVGHMAKKCLCESIIGPIIHCSTLIAESLLKTLQQKRLAPLLKSHSLRKRNRTY